MVFYRTKRHWVTSRHATIATGSRREWDVDRMSRAVDTALDAL